MENNSINEDDESFKPPPTPIMENDLNKIKEGESYACTECSSSIEIFYIDEFKLLRCYILRFINNINFIIYRKRN